MALQKHPLLSIVIPVLNEADNLRRQLDALHALEDIEVIVVDGGSIDDSLAVASISGAHVFTSQAGRARQMNLGVQHARADILVFLHADTLLDSTCQQQLLKLARTAQPFMWGHFMVRLSGRHWLLRWVERLMNLRSRWTRIATGDQTLFVERELFQTVGGFPEIALMEDIAISARLKKYRRPVVINTPVITSSRRWEQHGVITTILTMWLLRFAYWCGVKEHRLASFYYGKK